MSALRTRQVYNGSTRRVALNWLKPDWSPNSENLRGAEGGELIAAREVVGSAKGSNIFVGGVAK